MAIVLASASGSRRVMLEQAGVALIVDPAAIDETEIKESFAADKAGPADLAETLAELKARRVSPRHAGRIVIGSRSGSGMRGPAVRQARRSGRGPRANFWRCGAGPTG